MPIDFRPQSSTIVLPCCIDHCAQNSQGTGEPGHEVAVEHIHKHIRSGLNLGDTLIGAGDIVGAGAAGGDDLAREARTAQAFHCFVELIHRLPGLLDPHFPVRFQHAVPFIALDAAESEARQRGQVLRQRDRLLGRAHAAALHAHVHFDQDLEPASGGANGRGRARRSFCGSSTATVNRPCWLARARARILSLPRTWLAIKTSSMPARLMTMRLPDRGRADADGPGADLQESQLRAFMNLDVWTKLRVQRLHPHGHVTEVFLREIEIEDQGRRGKIGSRRPRPGEYAIFTCSCSSRIIAAASIRAHGGPVVSFRRP